MPVSAAEAFHAWHDFYAFIGTAAAILLGAMFVAASIGGGLLSRQHRPQIRSFLTPTVIHLASVVLLAAGAMVPSLGWRFLAVAFGAGGGAGVIYSAVVGWDIARRRLEWSSQIWYALIPVAAYAIVVAGALSVVLSAAPNLDALAAGGMLLLAAGIRNAWDMILFLVAGCRGE